MIVSRFFFEDPYFIKLARDWVLAIAVGALHLTCYLLLRANLPVNALNVAP